MDKAKKFIEKVKNIHGDNVDTSKVIYVNSKTKVCLICHKKDIQGNEHGEYWQSPAECVRGCDCPKCANERRGPSDRMTTSKLVSKAEKVHEGKYDYSKTSYVNANEKICIICPEHGEFWQLPYAHINGQGCPKCAGRSLSQNDIIERFNKIHDGKYDYSKVEYKGTKKSISIICPVHGEFRQSVHKHLSGQGCPICGNEQKNAERKLTFEDIVLRANKIHNNKYEYVEDDFKNIHEKMTIICPKHGEFKQNIYDHLNGHGCPICGLNESKAENEIVDFITNELKIENVSRRCRNIIPPYEIDIMINEHNIGIEYNGVLWHSEKYNKDKNYHLNKLTECNDKGIKLVQIFEDEYVERKEIVLSKIKHLLKKDDNLPKIYARKCEIREISKDIASIFLDRNHIQGFSSSSLYIGAYHNDDLTAVMAFERVNKKSDEWELTRFATDIQKHCVGLGGKLFRYFVKNYNPSAIKSFADRRWTMDKDNNLYVRLGFKLDKILKPDYSYVMSKSHRIHKFNFRKKNLIKKYGDYGLTADMTESKMADIIGASKIWDCGLFRYVWKNDSN